MKKTRFLAIAAFLAFLTACTKEYSYEGGPLTRCIDCSYLPLCDSTSFSYLDSSSTEDTLRGIVRIGNDTVINGGSYHTVTGFAPFPGGLQYSCVNGDYRTVFPLSSLGLDLESMVNDALADLQLPIPGSMVPIPQYITTSFLKTGQPVSGTWTDTAYHLGSAIFMAYAGLDYKIMQKGIQHTVQQKTYNDVIWVRCKPDVRISLAPVTLPDIDLDYYFAAGTGIIEMRLTIDGVRERSLQLLP